MHCSLSDMCKGALFHTRRGHLFHTVIPNLSCRCIGFLIFAVAAGVVVAIIMTIIKPNFNKITSAAGINSTNVTNWINSVSNSMGASEEGEMRPRAESGSVGRDGAEGGGKGGVPRGLRIKRGAQNQEHQCHPVTIWRINSVCAYRQCRQPVWEGDGAGEGFWTPHWAGKRRYNPHSAASFSLPSPTQQPAPLTESSFIVTGRHLYLLPLSTISIPICQQCITYPKPF